MGCQGGQYARELFGGIGSGNVVPSRRRGGRLGMGEGMSYFVTGATGFIGRYLVSNLLKRKGTVYVLVRKDSLKKLDAIAKKMGWDRKRVVVVDGDMTEAKCGVSAAQLRTLNGKIKHFFPL